MALGLAVAPGRKSPQVMRVPLESRAEGTGRRAVDLRSAGIRRREIISRPTLALRPILRTAAASWRSAEGERSLV